MKSDIRKNSVRKTTGKINFILPFNPLVFFILIVELSTFMVALFDFIQKFNFDGMKIAKKKFKSKPLKYSIISLREYYSCL